MKRFLIGLAIVATSLASLVGSSIYLWSIYPQDIPNEVLTARVERQVLNPDLIEQLVNDERVNAGLAPLAHSDKLRQSACLKLNDMDAREYWAHDAPDGTTPWSYIQEVGYYYYNVGENLAYGHPDETSLVRNWMNSEGHRKNILGDYTEQGICTAIVPYQGIDQVDLTVNHFATPLN